jgi:hypothetical protein
MSQVVPSGFAWSSPRNPEAIPHPVFVQATLNAPPLFDELWEPPTPAEWRRAIRILALQAVRQVLRGHVERGSLEHPVTWH